MNYLEYLHIKTNCLVMRYEKMPFGNFSYEICVNSYIREVLSVLYSKSLTTTTDSYETILPQLSTFK